MKKTRVLWLALLAMFALGAIASTSAFAASKFLLNGAEITSSISAEVTGELLLEDMNATGKPDILCSGIFDGKIEAGGVKAVAEAELTLGKELLEGTGGDLIEYEAHSTCTNPVDEVEINLPWNIEVMLTAGGRYYVLISKHAGGGGTGSHG